MDISASALLPYPERELADSSVIDKVDNLWASHKKFLVLSGPPGTGKTRAAEDYISELHRTSMSPVPLEDCRLSHLFPEFRTRIYSPHEIRTTLISKNIPIVWDLVVLHPQYSYEDLIRGFRAEPDPMSGSVSLVVREGLLGFAARVVEQLDAVKIEKGHRPSCVLILDEINRAPIGQLFGEAIYALDRRGSSVVTPYPLDNMGAMFSIPESVLILGTMNSIDRATSGFDFALRRRFANIPLVSSREPIRKYWDSAGSPPYGLILYDRLCSLIQEARSEGNVPVSELVLGHSYFLPPAFVTSLDEKITWLYTSYIYQILPTLLDYQEQGLLEFQDSALLMLPLNNKLNVSACSAIPLSSGIEIFKANLSSNGISL